MTTGAAVLASAHCHGALRARGSARPTSAHFCLSINRGRRVHTGLLPQVSLAHLDRKRPWPVRRGHNECVPSTRRNVS